jgi:hypothetical protein
MTHVWLLRSAQDDTFLFSRSLPCLIAHHGNGYFLR